MATIILSFSRRFQMWAYAVGHSQILLRSPKSADSPTRIDVLFKNVAFICLPTMCDGLAVSEATMEEETKLRSQLSLPRQVGRKLFVVSGADFTGYVVAGAVASYEDEREYDAPSHFALMPNNP